MTYPETLTRRLDEMIDGYSAKFEEAREAMNFWLDVRNHVVRARQLTETGASLDDITRAIEIPAQMRQRIDEMVKKRTSIPTVG